MLNLTKRQWLKHTVFHAFEGFEDLRWKKGGSLKISVIILALFFFAVIAEGRLYGFQFRFPDEKVFNIVPYFIKSIVLFAVWSVGNFAVCSILDGEGSLKKIWIYCSYALIPYISQLYINVILSHFLVRDEYIFMLIIKIIGTVWTAILLLSAVKAVHQFSLAKTLFAAFLTIIAMFIILFLLVLFLSLIQQIYVFVYSVFSELSYRIKV